MPTTSPAAVSAAASARWATPKSISLARGSASSITCTFCGLMSRWTTPREWAWSSASQRSAPISPISRSESSPSWASAGQGRALDQLGDEQRVAVLLPHLVEGDDAGMVEAGRGLGLAQDPAAGLAPLLDRLHRDRALEPAVPGLVDDAEAAAADAALDQEPVEHERADHRSPNFAGKGGLPAAWRLGKTHRLRGLLARLATRDVHTLGPVEDFASRRPPRRERPKRRPERQQIMLRRGLALGGGLRPADPDRARDQGLPRRPRQSASSATTRAR